MRRVTEPPQNQARPSFHPRHWGGWLVVALLKLLALVPYPSGLRMARLLAAPLQHLMARRAAIAERNIQRAFPELPEAEQAAMLRQHFRSLVVAPLEIAWAWSRDSDWFQAIGEVQGLAHINAARDEGRSVMLLVGHTTCLEIGARVLAGQVDFAPVYRPLGNPVLEWYQNRQRLRHLSQVISKRDLKGLLRALRGGKVVWYAVDQDFGPERSAFAPFFGIETATLTATRKLAAQTGCAVLPMLITRRPDDGYRVRILPELDGFPSEDERADLARINEATESMVREAPAQYWWIHRRFKTRPEGEADFYEGLGK